MPPPILFIEHYGSNPCFRDDPTDQPDGTPFAFCAQIFFPLRYNSLWFRFETLDFGGVHSFGAKVAKNLMSLLIEFDQTPTWHLPAGRALCCILFTVFIYLLFQFLHKKEVDVVLSEGINGCTNEEALRCSKGLG